MATLLHLDSSPMGDASVSRSLSQHFTEQWLKKNPGGKVITRDLTKISIAPVDATWVGAVYTPAEARTAEQKELLKLSDTLVGELREADEYVLGVPMHNFGIPSTLKLWLDQICRVGETFAYVDGKPKGLLENKKATILMASGGQYDEGTATASLNNVKPYLQSLFPFLGVADLGFVAAGGTMALRYGADRATFLQPHLASIEERFSVAS